MREISAAYTKEDYLEIKAWFEAHESSLPETMLINDSTYTPDLKATISMVFEQVEIYYDNHKMQGSYRLLEKIKRKLEEEYLK